MNAENPSGPENAGPTGSEAHHPSVGIGRVWSLRTVAAAAITAVALSGAAGAALATASDGGSTSGPGGRGGFGPPGQIARQNGRLPAPGQAPGGQPPQMNGVPGQPPSAATDGGRDT